MSAEPAPTALFVTCLVDQFFPEVGEASVALLEGSGSRVVFPAGQTCCGQPAFNMGYREEARELARRFIEIFEPYEEIVAPSGSCTAMVRVLYRELFEKEPEWRERARRLGPRVRELTEYLHRKGVPRFPAPGRSALRKVTYHESCHTLRELGVSQAPRELLRAAPGVELVEMEGAEVCCGFGGAFSVKLADLSGAMLEDKIRAAERTGAEWITATDSGCLLHLGGALSRRASPLRAAHVAEILNGTV